MKALVRSVLVPSLLVACAGHQPGVSSPPPTIHGPPVATRAVNGGERPSTASPEAAAPTEGPDEYSLRMLALAQAQFETFIRKAGNEPGFAEAVQRSREHIEDIVKTREFIAAGLEERRKR